MDHREYQVIDEVLKYIAHNKIAHPKDIKDATYKLGIDLNETDEALNELQQLELIENAFGKVYSIRLTIEGKKAYKLGFKKYCKLKSIHS